MRTVRPAKGAAIILCLLSVLLIAAHANAQANFTLTVAPASLSVVQGAQATGLVVTSISGGFNSSISLSASGFPPGAMVGFNPSTIPAPGAGTSAMTVSALLMVKPGTYPITVTANGGGIKQTATITITVMAPTQPNFTLTATPPSLTILAGHQATSAISTTIRNGFNSAVTLSATGMPSGASVSFSPQTIPAPGSGNSTMTVIVASNTPAGVYALTVNASGGGVHQAVAFLLTVPSFSLSASPAALTIAPGKQGTSVITSTITQGFNYPITLSASGMPSQVTVGFNPQTIPAPGSGNSTMTITVASNAPAGTYPITVKGTGGGLQQTAIVTLTVGTGGFTLSVVPASISLVQSLQSYSAVTTRIGGGFSSAITLTSSGAPQGMLVALSPNTIPAPGVGNSVLGISVLPGTSPGTYSITITATGVGSKQTVVVPVTVMAQGPNFTLSSAPAALTVAQSSQGNSSISAVIRGGFNSAINLSASGVPTGTTLHFSESSIPTPGSGNTPVNITVGSTTPAGTYPITVIGNGGGNQQNATLTLNVIPAGSQGLTQASFMEPYSYSLQASFGTPPYTFQIVSGSLPSGLTMDQQGHITGTPSGAGQFAFSVQVTDSSQPPRKQVFNYTLGVAVGLDAYSGLTAAPVPGCTSTGYFQLIKANGRWVLATPDCNAFYQRAIYDADYQFIQSGTFQQRYHGDATLWATHSLDRMLAYGFNSLDIYASTYMVPIGTWGQQNGANPQVPFALYFPVLNDVVVHPKDLGIPEAVKDLCAERDSNGYIGWCEYSLDVFDPKWTTANAGELANQLTEYTGGFNTSPWITAISLGDTSNVFSLSGNGVGPHGASQYPHPAMLIATINFNASGYQDNTIYSKYAWSNYLQTKYGNIAALNASWNTGGFYTSFGDAGGFGGGTGILDEDGRHTQWFGSDVYNRFYTLVGVNSNLVNDLNAFLYQYAYQAYAVQANTIRSYDTNHLLVCGSFGGVGDGGTRPQVLQALKDAGCNFFVWNWNSYYTATALSANQAEYDATGLPAALWYGISSQNDSGYSSYPYPQYGASFGDFVNQVTRGQQYANDMQLAFSSQGTNGDYYVLGTSLWSLTDNTSEKTNWGFITLMDNVYDGQCATMAASTDPWGYACGGEASNYGDYLDAVTQSNSNTLQQLILQILQH